MCVCFRHCECLHKRVVEQRPSSWSLECVVDEILDFPLPDVVTLHGPRVAYRRLGQKAKVLRAPFKFRLLRRRGEQQRTVPFMARACLELPSHRVFPPLAWVLGAASAISRPEPHVHCCRASPARVCKCVLRRMPWSEQEDASPFICGWSFQDLDEKEMRDADRLRRESKRL